MATTVHLLVLSIALAIPTGTSAKPQVIPLDQLTVEQAYLEVKLLTTQLSFSGNRPNTTEEQDDEIDLLINAVSYRFYKPNDRLPKRLHPLMKRFRQESTKWASPPGNAQSGFIYLLKTQSLIQLYGAMLLATWEALKQMNQVNAYQVQLNQTEQLIENIKNVSGPFGPKYVPDPSKTIEEADRVPVEAAIEKARDALMALPKVDDKEELITEPPSTSKMVQPPPPTRKASPPKKKNLFSILSRPIIWGPMAVLAVLGIGGLGYYHLFNGGPMAFSSDYLVDSLAIKASSTIASRGSFYIWYIFGGAVLIGLVLFWCFCIKAGQVIPEEEVTSKRASKKKSQLKSAVAKSVSPGTTGTPSTQGPTTTSTT